MSSATPSDLARDAGIALVSLNAVEWLPRALDLLREYCERTDHNFTTDDFRAWAVLWGLPAPHHHNAWGALVRSAGLAGYMAKVERTRKAVRVSSHARQLAIWKSLIVNPAKRSSAMATPCELCRQAPLGIAP